MLRSIYSKIMELAESRHAIWWLAAVSFIESSVFPIPPDVMLVPMVLAKRERAWFYAGVAVLSSVIGGWLGYAIGYSLYEAFGRPIIEFYHLQDGFAKFQGLFADYGAWIILGKGWTPIPYKLITISAGVAHLDPLTFTLASIGSRAMRFFLVAGLLWKFGEPIREFIDKRLGVVTTVAVIVIVAGFAALKLL